MELERDLSKRFIDFLISRGYPTSSLAPEYISKGYRIDLAIIDPETKAPVQFFEFKSGNDGRRLATGRLQVKRYMDALGLDIPAYLVYPTQEAPFFGIERCMTENEFMPVISPADSDDFNYAYRKQARQAEILNTSRDERKRKIDNFKLTCWILAAITGLLLILERTNCISIDWTPSDLIILGITIGLIIVPFTSYLKISGVEIKRLEKEGGKPDESKESKE